jgi:capsular polysaccharide biosynthesis protein
MLLWGGAGSSSIDQAEGHKEEWMEEYEVDLRDYFRVIWRKKWIILGITLTAILAAALASFTKPSQYQAQAVYQLQSAPTVKGVTLSSPSSEVAVAMLSSKELLRQAGKGLVDEARLLSSSLKVTVQKGDLIQVELRGALPPTALREVLGRLIELFSSEIKGQLEKEIQGELLRLERGLERLAALQAQLAQQIQELLERGENASLKVGELDATLEGFALRQELANLYGRLAPLQREMDSLNLSKEELSEIAGAGWEPLITISPPYASPAPIGPNRSMNLAVAGVLGLFVGVLLAFFIHYMEGGKQTEAKE